jgi:putative PEP-CTERM system histidine kinase
MTFSSIISFIGAVFSFGLAGLIFLRDRHSFVHRIFAIGMIALALEALFTGIGLLDILPDEVTYWEHFRLTFTAFIPGLWLLFALTYARVNYKVFLKKYRWMILAAFIIPFVLVTFFWKSFFTGKPILETSFILLRLGWSGYLFHLCFILSVVLILMNLERTLRGSVGHMRWQIKFMVLGIGSLFAVRLYTGTQTVLFRYLNMELELVNCGILLVVNALILKSLARARLFNVDFYLSQSFLYNSITLLIAGVYLLGVGILAKAIGYFNGGRSLYLNISLLFLIALGLSILLLSDRLRKRIKKFINLQLRRPQFDYRKEWAEFTHATTSVIDFKILCAAIVKKVSTTFDTLSVNIWLIDEKGEGLVLGGSTIFTELQVKNMMEGEKTGAELINLMSLQQVPVDLYQLKNGWAEGLKKAANIDYLKEFKIRYCIPLKTGENFLGFLTLDDRVSEEPLSVEEYDLLKTIGDQTAGILLNFKLSEHLRQMKETEAYQTMSAFIMHDLKNLASNLSLTMQNLPIHFNNPDFRNDALRMIQQSVTKLNNMCSRLSMLSQKIELKRTKTDLNELVITSLSCLNGPCKISLVQDLRPVPKLLIDPEQVQKVMNNLYLNANEAVRDKGVIRVSTEDQNGWVIFSVSDNGCGMSKEFIEQSLFRPFKTTKKQGMGIGLYQSKMIVEAHQGHIEVESEEGKGSTFRVFLPTTKE